MSAHDVLLLQYPGGDGLVSLSPPCLKVHLVLKRLGVEHAIHDARGPWEVRRLSGGGRVPALRIDGRWLRDSVSIVDDLLERWPERSFAPEDGVERAHDRLWDCFATDTFYWLGFYQRWLVPSQRRRLIAKAFAGSAVRRTVARTILPRILRRRALGQGVGELAPDQARRQFQRAMDTVEAGLGDGPFLQGRKEAGRGDFAIASLLVQAGYGNTMTEGFQRLSERRPLVEHVRRTFDAAGADVPAWWPR